jgi:hypothetical protein
MKHQLVTEVTFKREPGHLYFLDKAGDVGKRKINKGHTPSGPYGENHPNLKVLKLGLKKTPGYLYFLKPLPGTNVSQILTAQMRRSKKS